MRINLARDIGIMASAGVVWGVAASYVETPGWEGQPTVALPPQTGVVPTGGQPAVVTVCADRCIALPVVESCPCAAGTEDQIVAVLSQAAWELLTDSPTDAELVEVAVYLDPANVPLPGEEAGGG